MPICARFDCVGCYACKSIDFVALNVCFDYRFGKCEVLFVRIVARALPFGNVFFYLYALWQKVILQTPPATSMNSSKLVVTPRASMWAFFHLGKSGKMHGNDISPFLRLQMPCIRESLRLSWQMPGMIISGGTPLMLDARRQFESGDRFSQSLLDSQN